MTRRILFFITSCLFLIKLQAQHVGFQSHLSDYIENLAVFEQGQEEGRAYFIPDDHLSLNGPWKFFYSEVPDGIPSNFYATDFDDRNWDQINVPSNWEMQGYGDPLFRNISTTFSLRRPRNAPPDPYAGFRGPEPEIPFSVTPPEVPHEYNPTGAYRTSFQLPGDWKDQEVFLRFEKVASASFVWVNGKEVGYNEGAQEPAEYNITPFLKRGNNTIAVLVIKFSDGYYLEGQDYWRLAGIFDDVWVYATNPVRIFDWEVITDLDASYTNASLTLNLDVKSYREGGSDYRIHAFVAQGEEQIAVMESEPFLVTASTKTSLTLQQSIKNAEKWTSETPHLYDLSLELINSKGMVIDRIHTKFGIKKTEIRGNIFYLNGTPIKIHGINSHMQHPHLGHTMDEATIRKDFELLKQFNFNAVRTSHYPPVPKYLELANEYGLFIIDETGDEAHATEYVSDMPEYLPMYRERVQRMVLRDRNYPCILFWSAGNESGEGVNITEVVQEGKRLDPTRYWMYGGNADKHPGEDIIGPRYPSPIELEMNIGLGTDDQRPSFMDEYLSVAGNGGGGLDDYWRVIDAHPRLMGGAIWDFVSPGLSESVRRLEDHSPYHTPAHIMGKARLVPGPSGKALDLNGHDQWVEVYRADPVEIAGNQLTITMNVYPRILNRSSGSFLTKGNYQFGLEQHGKDSLAFYLYTGTKFSLMGALPTDWENHWHQIIATYDGTQMQLIIDGIIVATQPATGSIINLPFPVNIGRNVETQGQDTKVYTCDALIDQVGIFTTTDPIAVSEPSKSVLWLDFDEEKEEGKFFSYGIGARTYGAIWPDRKPQPEMWQMKHSVQPLSFRLENVQNGLVEVWNRSNFTTANHWETTWSLMADSDTLQTGVLELNTDPQARQVIRIPYTKPFIQPGKEYRIDLSTRLKTQERWAPTGFEVAWDQLELKDWNLAGPSSDWPTGSVQLLTPYPEKWQITGNGFNYTFDRATGSLTSMVVEGKEMLQSPLQLNVWRAPIANEVDRWNGYTMRSRRWKAGFDATLATDYYSNGIDALESVPLEVSAQPDGDRVVIHVRELVLTRGGATSFSMMDRYLNGLTLSGFECQYTYTIFADGTIKVDNIVLPQGNMPQMLPRLGISMMLNNSLDAVAWYGRGPQENYPDRKTGYRIGQWESTVHEMYEPYLIPQDYGLRTDTRWLQMTDEQGQGLHFAMNEPFNFNAYPFTTENLTRALYTYQLLPATGITLNLDYQTTGVGGTALPVLDGYRVYPHRYSRTLTIKPIRKKS
ncbi:MAG: glycoside hydrolase family 2 TIM barrel-domain containing protein [Saprospiraceae bacterium]